MTSPSFPGPKPSDLTGPQHHRHGLSHLSRATDEPLSTDQGIARATAHLLAPQNALLTDVLDALVNGTGGHARAQVKRWRHVTRSEAVDE